MTGKRESTREFAAALSEQLKTAAALSRSEAERRAAYEAHEKAMARVLAAAKVIAGEQA